MSPSPYLLSTSPVDPRFEDLWLRSDDASPFSHPLVVRALAEAAGLGVELVGLEESQESLRGAMWLFVKKKGPLAVAALPLFCPIHVPIIGRVRPRERSEVLSDLLAYASDRFGQATFALPRLGRDSQEYEFLDWQLDARYTYLIDLTGDVQAGFSRNATRIIKKHASEYEIVSGSRYAEVACSLMLSSYDRNGGVLSAGLDVTAGLMREAIRSGCAEAYAARRGGEIEAAVVIAKDATTAYSWIGGSLPGPAMTVLQGSILDSLRAEGLTLFDFCGANVPSIAEFKRRFGPVLAPTAIARKVSNPVLKTAAAFRSLVK